MRVFSPTYFNQRTVYNFHQHINTRSHISPKHELPGFSSNPRPPNCWSAFLVISSEAVQNPEVLNHIQKGEMSIASILLACHIGLYLPVIVLEVSNVTCTRFSSKPDMDTPIALAHNRCNTTLSDGLWSQMPTLAILPTNLDFTIKSPSMKGVPAVGIG